MLPLNFLGSRSHIRGAELLEVFLRAIAQAKPDLVPTFVASFKMQRPVTRQGCWLLGPDEEGSASATLDFLDSQGQPQQARFLANGPFVTGRIDAPPPPVTAVYPGADFSGEAELVPGLSAYGFINGVVEANKALHQATLASQGLLTPEIRLVYLERCPLTSPCGEGDRPLLLFRNRSLRRIGGVDYTLSQVTWPGQDGPPAVICFNFLQQEAP